MAVKIERNNYVAADDPKAWAVVQYRRQGAKVLFLGDKAECEREAQSFVNDLRNFAVEGR